MNTVMRFTVALLLAVITAVPAHADGTHPQGIKLDGTLGTAGQLSLPGPDYEIKSEYGQQAGANLFHSFQQFNVHQGESATFTGSDSVQNIISRVTGGSASWIDGKLGSEIPGADLYLLNSTGVMFGKNASVNLSGSFHVSTADYLRLGENDRFHSMPHASDVLSVSEPAAFGFLDNDISPITFKGGEISDPKNENHALIRVGEGESVSVIGGDIEMEGISYRGPKKDDEGNPVYEMDVECFVDDAPYCITTVVTDENGNPVPIIETYNPENIIAPGGQIRIAGAASAGEIVPAESGLEADVEKMGNISFSDRAKIGVSGNGGSIFIRGGQFAAADSSVSVDVSGTKDRGIIDIRADTVSIANDTKISAKCTDIVIRADSFTGQDATVDDPDRYSCSSDNVNLRIEAEDIAFDNMNFYLCGDTTIKALDSLSFKSSHNLEFGNIMLDAKNSVLFENVSLRTYGDITMEAENISVANTSVGSEEDIEIKAQDLFSVSGSDNQGSRIYVAQGTYAGSVDIEAENILFTGYAYIDASPYQYSEDNGGNIMLKAEDSVSFVSGIIKKHDSAQEDTGYSGLNVSSMTGDAGSVLIEGGSISFEHGAFIDASTYGTGKGGSVTLEARDSVEFSGECEIDGELHSPDTRWNSRISIASMAKYPGEGDGDGGSLEIEAENILFADGAYISSETTGTGKGGEVKLEAADSLSFIGEDHAGARTGIEASAKYDKPGAGKAGLIEIEAGNNILFTDGAYINSETFGTGNGGHVKLKAKDSLSFAGESREGIGAGIEASTKYNEAGAGDAGILEIEAEKYF